MNAMMTRREMLQSLGLLAAGAIAGCTPIRMALHKYPGEFDRDGALAEQTLAAFVEAVVPGTTGEPRDLARVYFDDYYPFAPYRGFFAADLCRRAEERFGKSQFQTLGGAERARVIRDGLDADPITRQLYEGAIILAQVSQYAGIYNDAQGCALIGFGGENQGFPADVLTYPSAGNFLPAGITADGNHP